METRQTKTWIFAEHPSEGGRWFCVHTKKPGLIGSLSKDAEGRIQVNALRWLSDTPNEEGTSQVATPERKQQILEEAKRTATEFCSTHRSVNVRTHPDSSAPKWIVGPGLYFEGGDGSPLYVVHTEHPCFVALTEQVANNLEEVVEVEQLEPGLQPDKALLEQALYARNVLFTRWMDEIRMLVDPGNTRLTNDR